MNWIKKNPAQLALAIAALLLIGASVKFLLDAQTFPEKFAPASAAPNKSKKIPEVDKGPIEDAKRHFVSPTAWVSPIHSGLLFTSEKYFVEQGRLTKSNKGVHYDYLTGNEITFKWFEDYGLPVNDDAIVTEDNDGDGFLNADEWRESRQLPNNKDTDPTKKDSHPPYYKRLWLKDWVRVPFRLKFASYNGDPKKPETLEFQINTLDLRTPSEFLKLNEAIPKTKFKIIKFEPKTKMNTSIQEEEDVSELTVENTETKEQVVLIYARVVDSPNQFAKFEYLWGKKLGQQGQVFDVPVLKEFVLQPDVNQKYKLQSVTNDAAVILLSDGKTEVTITRYPPPPAKR